MGLLGEDGSVPAQKIAGRLRSDFPEAQHDFLVQTFDFGLSSAVTLGGCHVAIIAFLSEGVRSQEAKDDG
jgi:hypothetical protein